MYITISELHNYIVRRDDSIKQVLKKIESNKIKIALVANEEGRLLGTITDGDIRRGLLCGKNLDSPLCQIMNVSPEVIVSLENGEKSHIHPLDPNHKYIPVVDSKGRIKTLECLMEVLSENDLENYAIIMAGGRGERLKPLTDHTPKPMLKINGKPILEHLILNLREQGFRKFIITINYLAEHITSYFGDGSKLGIEITYVKEGLPLGTAGALGLIEKKIDKPFLLMNADLISHIDYKSLIHFYEETQSYATVCVREQIHGIPFGVVETEGYMLKKITEKPSKSYLISAGIYFLSPDVRQYVEKNSFLNMPQLLEKLQDDKKLVSAFHVRESWLDIGRLEDLSKADIFL